MRQLMVLAALVLLTVTATPTEAADPARLLRFADIHEDMIAFVYAGDIWTVAADGGQAHRLTSHPGMELFPKFSPDGRSIAFSAEYGGNRQVYVIDVEGGEPRQLTFYNDVGPMPPRGGFDNQVLDWSPDGHHVLFRANRLPWGVRMGRPYLVPAEGGMERPLAVPESGGGMFSPDGSKLVYTPISREFRTWKGYRGGRAQDVWIYDLKQNRAEQITDFSGTDNQPLWIGETIYFTSDRGGRLNLYAYEIASRRTTQLTRHEDFDVLWPSAGARQIVYEAGGYLYRLDPALGESVRVPIRIATDRVHALPSIRGVADDIGSTAISPTGKRALVEARGELFTLPAEHGEVRNLTRTPGVREMSPTWSPDGRWIAYLSDLSGEYEIYVRSHDGSGAERRLTEDGDVWLYPPVWSPDSKMLAFGDRKQRLRYLSVDGPGKVIEIDRSASGDITSCSWSPDSRWISYAKIDPSQFSSIFVYSLDRGSVLRLTEETTNDYEPVFDPEGRYLYFLSDRDFNLTFSGFEFNYFYTDPTRLYAATLAADGPPLLAPRSDEEQPETPSDEEEEKEEKEENSKGGAAAPEVAATRVDAEGFADRVLALPGAADSYRGLTATADGVLFLVGGGADTELKRFLVEEQKTETILSGISGYDLSRDGKKLLYSQPEKIGIVDLAPGQTPGKGLLELNRLATRVDPGAEWRQIFVDGWRITRDWFYDAGMHGLDWKEMRTLYEPLVEHVAHRGDLDYILGELGGELNAGHFYVNWGDMPAVERVENGLLGAEIESHESGYFEIKKILPGENWHESFRSPLRASGVDVDAGDLILAVDGRSTRDVKNFYSLLENSAGRTVVLRINDRPREEGAHDESVRPVARETNLRYLDWLASRREMVDRLSGGRIGYIHLPNTATEGNRELRKHFYPLARKEALIFDVRYNGGGFIPDRMIELLTRRHLSFWARRGIEPMRTPGFAHVGPKACLINAYSSSGGDAFPYYFREMGLGKVIGTRTWGGLIGLSGNPGFLDGGSLSVPTFRFVDMQGNWDVENVGVAPDIEVLDRPDLVAQGQDPTLEKAVELLLEELKNSPVAAPEPPPAPRYER